MSRYLVVLSFVCFTMPAFGADDYAAKKDVEIHPGELVDVGNVRITAKEKPKKPIRTEQCVKFSPSGVCSEKDVTYTVQGASCTEDCYKYGSFDKCEIRNTCKFDEQSGCFRKSVCATLNSVGSCAEWSEQAQCG